MWAAAASVAPGATVMAGSRKCFRTSWALIATALREAVSLMLTSDADRDGESIVRQVLGWMPHREAVGETPKHKTVLDGFTPDAGEGPSFIKVRRRVFYDIEVLDTWLKERVRRHTGESGDA